MPELPEVETVRQLLQSQIQGKTIQGGQVYWPAIVYHRAQFIEAVRGQTIHKIGRRGKYLLFHLDSCILVVHLRMEGKFYLQDKDSALKKHTHVSLDLGDVRLDYHDVRKFGRFECIESIETYFKDKLGYEPFDERLTGDYLKSLAQPRSIPLKAYLLDQRMMAGIGNIYADEICFEASVSPFKKVNRISLDEWNLILVSTRKILQAAIDSGGSTIRSYTSSLGVTGLFQQSLHVYGRAQQACHVCGNPLERGVVNQRSTVYCLQCQKVSQHARRHYRAHGKR